MLVTWEGLLIVFVQGLTNGGPAGLVYGYLLAWMGTLAVFLPWPSLPRWPLQVLDNTTGLPYWLLHPVRSS